MSMTPEQISAELKRISSRVPKYLLNMVSDEVKLTPTIEDVALKAMSGGIKDTEKRKEITRLFNEGEFSKKKVVENPKVAKQLDNWYAREINKAIREGRLPHANKLKDPFLREIKNNINGKN